ncbi:MAG: hypothetical protein K2M83_01935 [Muribaculaceae bacterium]|nr:hypothetical protein [Clostridia bacterium]MDE6192731.1 hypothetical protein [Muribaculaceae bacterium]
MIAINDDFLEEEYIVRNVYHSSQYSNKTGLKKNYLYPNYRKESKQYKGKHVCRISVQRVCYGGWKGVIEWAKSQEGEHRTLIGFGVASINTVRKYGFCMETAAHDNNPFHAHIYIPELDLPYPSEIDSIFNSGLRRRLDDMTEDFKFIELEDIINHKDVYFDCVSEGCFLLKYK